MRIDRLRFWLTLGTGLLAALFAAPAGHLVGEKQVAELYQAEQAGAKDKLFFFCTTPDPVTHPDGQADEGIWIVDTSGRATILATGEDGGTEVDGISTEARDAAGSLVFHRQDDGHGPYLLGAGLRADGRIAVLAWFLNDYQARARHARLLAWSYAAGAVALMAAATWLLTGAALKPIRRAALLRQEFLSDAAHEMRTPLAVIRASASQILSRPREAGDYVEALTEIRDAAERTGDSVLQLLDFTRLSSGEVTLVRDPLRLDLLAEELASTATARGSTVELRAGTPVVVDGDEALLRQAIDNLIRNAAARARHIELTVTTHGREAVITVRDDGPGFDPALLPYVFHRFARGRRTDQGTGHSTGHSAGHSTGHGVGLALVRTIAELHAGRVEAANRPDRGAEVRITLPLSAHR